MTEHTKGPWEVYYQPGFLSGSYIGIKSRWGYGNVLQLHSSHFKHENAHRIVACVNFCDGIENKDLEGDKNLAWLFKEWESEFNYRSRLSNQLHWIGKQIKDALAGRGVVPTIKHEIQEELELIDRVAAQRNAFLVAAKLALAECADLIATPAGDALQAAVDAAEGGAS